MKDLMFLPKYKLHEVSTEDEVTSKGERIDWSHQLFGIPRIWRQAAGEGIKVAILDTGIDTDHQDFEGAISDYKDFTGEGIEDVQGHGTHCAGIVGARLNNRGFVGIAPMCDLAIGKVLNNKGQGTLEQIAEGVDWSVDIGCQVISMSLGGPGTNNRLFKSIHNALAQGVVVVCAAGNEGSTFSNTIGYPGRYGGVITIASHDSNGNRSGFSSRGGEIDFMAPGQQIYSCFPNNKYASLSGTSMATPFVAGICALVMSGRGDIENCEDMRNVLLQMAAHPGCHDNIAGYGPLNPFSYFYRG